MRLRRVQVLRKFGAPPKIRSFLLRVTCRVHRRAFVTPLIYWTFPVERAAASVLARFLRGNVRRSLFVSLRTMTKDVNLDRSLNDRGFFTTPRRKKDEALHCPSIAGWRIRRLKHYGSQRRRLRCRCLSGGLRCRTPCCPSCRRCTTSWRRRTATGRRPPQGVLTVVRRVFPRTSCRSRAAGCLLRSRDLRIFGTSPNFRRP